MNERLMEKLRILTPDEPHWFDAAHAEMTPEQFHEFVSQWWDHKTGPEGFRVLQVHMPANGNKMYDRALVIRVA